MIQPKTWDNMSPTTRRSLERIIKSSANMQLQDAINMFREMVKREPELIPAREQLRALELRKAQETNAKPEGGMTNFMFSLKTSFAGKDMLKSIALCEDALSVNINNITVLKKLAEFAEKAEAVFIGIEAMKTALTLFPDDPSLKITLGKLYMLEKDPDTALTIYQELFDSKPDKSEYKLLVKEAMNAITAREESKKAEEEAARKAEEKKAIQSRDSQGAIVQQLLDGTIRDVDQAKLVITELTKSLERRESLDVRRKLAEAYKIAGDYDAAIAHLEFINESIKTFDVVLDKEIEKLYVRKFDTAIKTIQSNPAAYENAQQQIEELEISKLRFKLGRAARRVENSPNDAQLHFELGQEYYNCSLTDEAIKEFSISVKHPHWQPQSTYYLGRLVLNQNNIPLAVEYLTQASEIIGLREPNFKKCLYYLGISHEKNGDADKARAVFERLHHIDQKFLDVANHLS